MLLRIKKKATMSNFIAIIALQFIVIACTTPQDELLPVGAGVKSQYFTFNYGKDTSFSSSAGIKVLLSSNFCDNCASDEVLTLELKEAFTPKDILLAGLHTLDQDDELLSTKGMFYLDIKNGKGEKITLSSPLEIEFPIDQYEKDLGVYQLNEQNRWDDLEVFDEENFPTVIQGKLLFEKNCRSCHAIARRVIGPPLAYITEDRSMAWLKEFTVNNQKLIASGDSISICVYTQHGKQQMNAFTSFTEQDVTQLYDYIAFESKKYEKDSLDLAYRTICNEAETRDSLIGSFFSAQQLQDSLRKEEEINRALFSLSSFRWVNVDYFYRTTESVAFDARLVSSTSAMNMKGFLFYTEEKVYIPCNVNGDKLSLAKARPRLPLGKKAGIVVFGFTNKDFYVADTSFLIEKENKLTLSLELLKEQSIEAYLENKFM